MRMPGLPTRQTLILAAGILLAALFLLFWGCPFIATFGHDGLCIALYALLLLIYFYGRGGAKRPRGPTHLPR